MRKVIELMRGRDAERQGLVDSVLRRRAGSWTDDLGGMVQELRQIATTCLPSELVMTLWRFLFCAWCMMSRYAQEALTCRFCEAPEADKQGHNADCPEMRRWLQRFGFGAQP